MRHEYCKVALVCLATGHERQLKKPEHRGSGFLVHPRVFRIISQTPCIKEERLHVSDFSEVCYQSLAALSAEGCCISRTWKHGTCHLKAMSIQKKLCIPYYKRKRQKSKAFIFEWGKQTVLFSCKNQGSQH